MPRLGSSSGGRGGLNVVGVNNSVRVSGVRNGGGLLVLIHLVVVVLLPEVLVLVGVIVLVGGVLLGSLGEVNDLAAGTAANDVVQRDGALAFGTLLVILLFGCAS